MPRAKAKTSKRQDGGAGGSGALTMLAGAHLADPRDAYGTKELSKARRIIDAELGPDMDVVDAILAVPSDALRETFQYSYRRRIFARRGTVEALAAQLDRLLGGWGAGNGAGAVAPVAKVQADSAELLDADARKVIHNFRAHLKQSHYGNREHAILTVRVYTGGYRPEECASDVLRVDCFMAHGGIEQACGRLFALARELDPQAQCSTDRFQGNVGRSTD